MTYGCFIPENRMFILHFRYSVPTELFAGSCRGYKNVSFLLNVTDVGMIVITKTQITRIVNIEFTTAAETTLLNEIEPLCFLLGLNQIYSAEI